MPLRLCSKENDALAKKIESLSKIILANNPCSFYVYSGLKCLVVAIKGRKRCSKYVYYYKSNYSAILTMPSLLE